MNSAGKRRLSSTRVFFGETNNAFNDDDMKKIGRQRGAEEKGEIIPLTTYYIFCHLSRLTFLMVI